MNKEQTLQPLISALLNEFFIFYFSILEIQLPSMFDKNILIHNSAPPEKTLWVCWFNGSKFPF